MLDLPRDLIEEILSRVPARSLKRLRFTCKRWNALFREPEFIKKHLEKGEKQHLVLILSNFKFYSLSLNLDASHNDNNVVDPSIELLSRSLNESVEISEVSYCNGLLLCTMKESNIKLVVVNPCTGQTRWIKPTSVYSRSNWYALGYENSNYKIVSFQPGSSDEFGIFDLKSNSWRFYADITLEMHIHPEMHITCFSRGAYLKGNSYWLASPLSNFGILSFDFKREEFRHVCLPVEKPGFHTVDLSVVREEQLSVLQFSSHTRQMEIWVSDKIDTEGVLSWRKSFTLDLPSQLTRVTGCLSFVFDQEKKVVVCCDRREENNNNRMYIVGDHGYRELDYESSSDCTPFLFTYVPSWLPFQVALV